MNDGLVSFGERCATVSRYGVASLIALALVWVTGLEPLLHDSVARRSAFDERNRRSHVLEATAARLAREAVALEAQKEFLSNSERSTKPDLPTLEQQRLEAIRDGKTQAVSDLNRAIEKCQEQSTPVLIRRADLERAIAIHSNRAERLKREQQAETERYKKLRESCRSYNLI
jgi:chromosome segregation ATPase